MQSNDPIQIVLAFVDAINAQDLKRLDNITNEDFRLIDATGKMFHGRARTRNAWSKLFDLFPDYEISTSEIVSKDNLIFMIGTVCGTHAVLGTLLSTNRRSISAAWRAKVEKDKVSEWQIYADDSKVKQIIVETKKHSRRTSRDKRHPPPEVS